MKLLCLSNGHGEDAIAIAILRQLQQQPNPPEIAALPIVGEGQAYRAENIPIVGPVRQMPSGGFIYMDGKQLWRDVRGGLLGLTLAQLRVAKQWAKEGGKILAVGDIVPLFFAWWSGAEYAFVGTAKSDYYLRDEAGWLPRRHWWQHLERWSGSVYLPWERALMRSRRCQAVFPRDSLTAERLQKFGIRTFDAGNPMMDALDAKPPKTDSEMEMGRSLAVVLLPGSRPTEAVRNWELMMRAVARFREAFADRNLLFLGAIAPTIPLESLQTQLSTYGWQERQDKAIVADEQAVNFVQNNATFVLTQNAFSDCLHRADLALAMAGTATEQFVGLGKPAIAFPGGGPQFTDAFAEAQRRLLGLSLILVPSPDNVAEVAKRLLQDPDWLQAIAENGRRRLGEPGASDRIAKCLQNIGLTSVPLAQ